MFEKLVSPFVGYWYWAQDRGTPAAKGLALGAPLVGFALVLYLLFGSGGGGGSFGPVASGTQDNVAGTTPGPGASPVATQPAAGGQRTSNGSSTDATAGPATTAGPAPTAFTQMRYTVEPGDNPSLIAEKVGVPLEGRDAWIEEMLALNGVTATTLQVGQELILPPF